MIRVLDLEFITKDAHGSVRKVERDELENPDGFGGAPTWRPLDDSNVRSARRSDVTDKDSREGRRRCGARARAAPQAAALGCAGSWGWYVQHQPVEAQPRDCGGELLELDWLADVAVGPEVVSVDQVTVFA